MKRQWILGLCVGATCLPPALAGDWPQFRGPDNAGVSAETRLPVEWGAEKNVAWKVKVPGYGWSSPIVWGDKVFVTTAVSDKQPPPQGFPGPGGSGGAPPAAPLLAPETAARLKLTDEQKEQVRKLQKDFAGKQGPMARAFEALTKAQADPDPDAMSRAGEKLRQAFQAGEKLRRDYEAKLRDLLDDGQKKTFDRARRAQAGAIPGMGPPPKPPDTVYRWEVYCLDAADGKVLWKRVAARHKPNRPIQPSNTYASETPVTDGEGIYASFGMAGLYCYDLAGKLLWNKNLGSYPMMGGWGTGSSPALDGDRLFVQCDNEKKSFLVALDKKTGDELWRVGRDEKSSWCTPFVWRNKARTEVVACGARRVRSYDPATGRLLWELGGTTGGMATANATPVAGGGLLYASSGASFGTNPLFAVRPGASGDLTVKQGETPNTGVAWSRTRGGPVMASPLLYGGHVYILDQSGGLLSCYDAQTGKPVYRERLPGAHGFTASPWAYAGKVFCLDGDGQTFVVRAGPKFKVLGKNSVGEMCWATPAVANGALFLRCRDHLYCIRRPAEEGAKP